MRRCWASASAAIWRWTSPSSRRCFPRALNRGKDLGVINIANSLPQVLAPLIAFPFVTFWGGYVALYVAAALIGLLGAVFVVKIKGVD